MEKTALPWYSCLCASEVVLCFLGGFFGRLQQKALEAAVRAASHVTWECWDVSSERY